MRLPGLRRTARGTVEERYDAALAALDDGDPERAVSILDTVVRELRATDPGAAVDALVLRSDAEWERGRFDRALRDADEAQRAAPEHAEAWLRAGLALYRLGRFEEAAARLDRACALEPGDAAAWHALGRARLWLDDRRGADAALRKAASLSDEHVVPVRIAAGEFDRVAAEVWRAIPASFRARLDNAIIVAQPLPDADDVEGGFDPDTLGVYEGATALHEGDMPERIVLFQLNHETVCGSLGELREEIRRTILHEVGHHFGMEEGELPF